MDDNSSRKIRLEHLISFSDAIFAFSITFMAISIQIPNFPIDHMTEQQFISKLSQLLSQFEIYGVSFMIVGVYWISYHRVFNHIRPSYSVLIWLNLLFLFFITLISFATYLDFKYGNFHSMFVLYASILTLTGSLLVFIWLHGSKESLLIDKDTSIFQRLRSRYSASDILDFDRNFVYQYSSCPIFLDTHICSENSSTEKIFRNPEEIIWDQMYVYYLCLLRAPQSSLSTDD